MVSEEYPAEHDEVECEHDGTDAAQSVAQVVLIMMEQVLTHPFVYGESYAVHAAPSYEVQTGSLNQVDSEMCQRRQKSVMLTEV